MPRRGNVPKREILPDPVYGSVLVTRLINSVMLDGKKGVAQKVVYGAFDIIKEKTGKEPMEFTPRLWRTSCPPWRSRPAVWAAPPTRCLSKFALTAVRPWGCAGSPTTAAPAARTP